MSGIWKSAGFINKRSWIKIFEMKIKSANANELHRNDPTWLFNGTDCCCKLTFYSRQHFISPSCANSKPFCELTKTDFCNFTKKTF